MAQKSSKQQAEEAVLDLKGKLRQLNKVLASKGATIAENAPLVDTIKAVEGMTAGGGGSAKSFPIYRIGQFEGYPDAELPPLRFAPSFTSGYSLFANCPIVSLEKPIEGIERIVSLDSAFKGCGQMKRAIVGSASLVQTIANAFNSCNNLEEVEITTSPACTNMLAAFSGCGKLRTIRGTIDASSCVTTYATFLSCSSLEEVRIKGLKVDIDLSPCGNLSVESVRYLINNAQNVTGKRIDLSRKLLDANEEALGDLGDTASDKGWTINYK